MKTTALIFAGILATSLAATAPEREEKRSLLRGAAKAKKAARARTFTAPVQPVTTTVVETETYTYNTAVGGNGGSANSGGVFTGDATTYNEVGTVTSGNSNNVGTYVEGVANTGGVSTGPATGGNGGSATATTTVSNGGRNLFGFSAPQPKIIKKTTTTTYNGAFGGSGGTVNSGIVGTGDATSQTQVLTGTKGHENTVYTEVGTVSNTGGIVTGPASGANGGEADAEVEVEGGDRKLFSFPQPKIIKKTTTTTYNGAFGGSGGTVNSGGIQTGDAQAYSGVGTLTKGGYNTVTTEVYSGANTGGIETGSASGANGGDADAEVEVEGGDRKLFSFPQPKIIKKTTTTTYNGAFGGSGGTVNSGIVGTGDATSQTQVLTGTKGGYNTVTTGVYTEANTGGIVTGPASGANGGEADAEVEVEGGDRKLFSFSAPQPKIIKKTTTTTYNGAFGGSGGTVNSGGIQTGDAQAYSGVGTITKGGSNTVTTGVYTEANTGGIVTGPASGANGGEADAKVEVVNP